jgi:SEC-C motif
MQDVRRLISMEKFPVNDPCPCGSGVKYKKCHGHPVAEKRPSTPLPVYEPIKLVRQEDIDGCAIATAAMVAGTSYRETLEKIGIMPTSEESAAIYMSREGKFFNDRGWWVSAQLVLKTTVDLDTLDALIERDVKMSKAVKNSQRLRIFLAFSDGKKPDHSVIWDKDNKDVVYDPTLGVVPISHIVAPPPSFHIKENDCLGTLATVVDRASQSLKKKGVR